MIDRPVLERFVADYADKAYSFALGLSDDEHLARDLVQEAFVKVFENADRLEEAKGLDQWFLTVMKRLYVDGLRLMDNQPRVDFDCPIGNGLTVADALPDEREQALTARLERTETKALVRRGMLRLSPEHRAIILMIDMNGARYEDAASVMGLPLNTVRSRIVRARAALRDVMLELEVTP